MKCNACGRDGARGDRVGDTCGWPLDRPFLVQTDEGFADAVARFRRGEPADITRPRCRGLLTEDDA